MSCQTSTRGYQACGHASLPGLTRCLSGTARRPPQGKMEKFKMENGNLKWKIHHPSQLNIQHCHSFNIQHHPHPPNSTFKIQHSTLSEVQNSTLPQLQHSTSPPPSPNSTFKIQHSTLSEVQHSKFNIQHYHHWFWLKFFRDFFAYFTKL